MKPRIFIKALKAHFGRTALIMGFAALTLGMPLANAHKNTASNQTGTSIEPTSPEENGWILDPDSALADRFFDLTLRNSRYNCSHEFSHLQVAVESGAIHLSLTSTLNPARLCTTELPSQPFGPTFRMPALKSGIYKVYVSDGPACLWTQPACKIAVQQEFAGELSVGTGNPVGIEFSLSPGSVKAQSDFDLQLLTYSYNCATQYSHQAYTVNGNTLTLSFLPTTREDVACPAIYMPYGPSFRIKALPAGIYSVYAEVGIACMYADPRCEIAALPLPVGTLVVGDGPGEAAWFVNPERVTAEKNFTLDLLSQSYGNCQSEFPNAKAEAANGGLNLHFDIAQYPDRVCVTDIRPFGPQFKVEPLKAGTYPVRVQTNACPPNALCVAGPLWTVVDTLVVVDPKKELGFSPGQVQPGSPFELKLFSDIIPCGVLISKKQVAVMGQTIYLGFKVEENWAVDCVSEYRFNQIFSVPGLKTGSYKIVLDPQDSCASSGPLCEERYQSEGLGTLVAGEALSLFPSQRRAKALKALRLAPGKMEWVLPDGRGRAAVNPLGRALPAGSPPPAP